MKCPCKCHQCENLGIHCYSSPCVKCSRIDEKVTMKVLDTALTSRAEDELPGVKTQGPDPRLTLPWDSVARKGIPLAAVLDYFPAALVEVARLCKAGNDKHNPGQPLHWARGKSQDHADCIIKHFVDRGLPDPEDNISHTVKLVWRALALLQLECEANGAPMSRGSHG